MRLKVEGLVREYAGERALDGLTFETSEVGCLAIVGPSGGGKSTLFRVLAGLDLPTAGTVSFDGVELPVLESELRAYRQTLGIVFQTHNLFPHLNALENILLPLVRVHGLRRSDALERAHELLARFRLGGHAHKMPMQLSGGQRQRIAIVRAAALQPRYLLCDEPTSSLDPEMTAEVLRLLEELKAEGRTIVLVTHAISFARRMADEVLFLARGRARAFGAPQDVLSGTPNLEVRQFL